MEPNKLWFTLGLPSNQPGKGTGLSQNERTPVELVSWRLHCILNAAKSGFSQQRMRSKVHDCNPKQPVLLTVAHVSNR